MVNAQRREQKLSNRTYDILKTIALIAAPLITFIGAVCIIWHVPFAEQITATLAALDTLLGALLTKLGIDYNTDLMLNNEVEDMGKGDENE